MKILTISPRIPSDGKKGDQVLSFHRLAYLARNHQIRLICYGDIEKDLEAKLKLESLGISVSLIPWKRSVAIVNTLLSIFRRETPIQCAVYSSQSFKDFFDKTLYEFEPDIVYAVTIRSLENVRAYSGPMIVDLIDSMGLNFSRRIRNAGGLKKFMLQIECRRVKAFETNVAESANLSFVVSSIDKEAIGNDKINVIPLGIDIQQFTRNPSKHVDPVIIFTGNMNYKPNVDAVLWFHEHCWDKLKMALPRCSWVIAGSNPTAEVVALSSDSGITVTGRVKSLATLINAADVSIAPMQSGSGMQFKILEAMACGVPVVATTLGFGDIKAQAGRDIFLADTPDKFIEFVLSLLQSRELRFNIGNAGWEYVNLHHTWNSINQQFETQLIRSLS